MDYKKIIKNQEMRFKILHALRFIPDTWMIEAQYVMKLGRKPNLKQPKRFTEKLQWYKLNYKNPLMTRCSDKLDVRSYIKTKGLEDTLVKLYGVYENVEQIDFDSLPKKFVMKTTNGSGTNIFCKDKSEFSFSNAKSLLKGWLNRDCFSAGREWSYKGIAPRVIVEELLEDESNPYEGINDYKFMCFNGNAKYVVMDVERHVNHRRNLYDIKWNFLDVNTDHPNFGDCVPKPEGLARMTEVANALASEFPFVRVDLYWVNSQVYFGELTFYPWTGYVQFDPDEFDFTLGSELILESYLES